MSVDELTDDELVLMLFRDLQCQGIRFSGNATARAIKRGLAERGISIPRKRLLELMRTHAMSQ